MLRHILDAFTLLCSNDSELREIIFVTLRMSFYSTTVASLIGIPIGILIGANDFFGKKLVRRLCNTLMGIPPVVGGLIVFLLLSRSGPLGEYKLLYSVKAMVIAQVVLITPIVVSLTLPNVGKIAPSIHETADGIHLSAPVTYYLLFHECRKELVSIIASAFGRSIAEVGAVSLVGGNIQFKTRVMTTAIMLETNRGNFQFAVALGIVLLLISFGINSIVACLQE